MGGEELRGRHPFDEPNLISPFGAVFLNLPGQTLTCTLDSLVLPSPGTWAVSSEGRGRVKCKSWLTVPPGTAFHSRFHD